MTLPARPRPRATLVEFAAWCFFAGFVGGGVGTAVELAALHAVGRL